MNPIVRHRKSMAILVILLCGILSAWESGLRIFPPRLDPAGRFWIYRNDPNRPAMPFRPYGWMSDGPADKVISLDLECSSNPHLEAGQDVPSKDDVCMHVEMQWNLAVWAAIAFISGPDTPAPGWWGDDKRGWYYDLRGLKKKKLVFWARGEKGGEVIEVQMGILGKKKPFGDSVSKPFSGELPSLTKDWTRFEIDFSGIPVSELERVCSGFVIRAEWFNQPEPSLATRFYIDDVYLE
jgi:hypothetical protein